MIDELELVQRARPRVDPPSDQAKSAARRTLDEAIGGKKTARRPGVRRRFGIGLLVPALSAVVVVAVVALFLGLHTHTPGSAGRQGGLRLEFRALPIAHQHQVTPAAMERTVRLVRQRLEPLAGARVSSAGDELIVTVGKAAKASEVAALVRSSRLLFYDWEADAITPRGLPVAGRLQSHDAAALLISQGSRGASPGTPGAGSMPLYAAVRLAARQPRWISAANSRRGAEYFLFGRPGSAACAAAAHRHSRSAARAHCFLAGPEASLAALAHALPPGVTPTSHGVQTLTVRQGWVILRAIAQHYRHQAPGADPAGRYYVLKDDVSLSSQDLTDVHQSADATGEPDVSFGFTRRGGAQFQTITARIAHRGQLLSGRAQHVNQHFAVALGTQLITVPYIDFAQDPFGIPPGNGADIEAGFTARSARQLVAEITPLPVRLLLPSSGTAPGGPSR